MVAGAKGAAQRLGLKRTTLLSRMKRLGIDKIGIDLTDGYTRSTFNERRRYGSFSKKSINRNS
ncbi:hypothetical protein DMI69_25335 [Escherichia coli]|nr:hypothetical protein [Escherichia coli]